MRLCLSSCSSFPRLPDYPQCGDPVKLFLVRTWGFAQGDFAQDLVEAARAGEFVIETARPGDALALVRVLAILLQCASQRREFGPTGFERVQRFIQRRPEV